VAGTSVATGAWVGTGVAVEQAAMTATSDSNAKRRSIKGMCIASSS
jgi:hypothetical protein